MVHWSSTALLSGRLVAHVLLDALGVDFGQIVKVLPKAMARLVGGVEQVAFPLRPLAAQLPVHGQTSPLGQRGRFPSGAGVEHLPGGLWGQVFVKIVVQLHHGGVRARAEALDLAQREEAVRGGLVVLYP